MRFTLDGESFDLTPDIVRHRLQGHLPEDIRAYSVNVDGTPWPVKQVIAVATGASRTRFQSQAARGWLLRLGFPVSPSGSAPRGGASGSQVRGVTFNSDRL